MAGASVNPEDLCLYAKVITFHSIWLVFLWNRCFSPLTTYSLPKYFQVGLRLSISEFKLVTAAYAPSLTLADALEGRSSTIPSKHPVHNLKATSLNSRIPTRRATVQLLQCGRIARFFHFWKHFLLSSLWTQEGDISSGICLPGFVVRVSRILGACALERK